MIYILIFVVLVGIYTYVNQKKDITTIKRNGIKTTGVIIENGDWRQCTKPTNDRKWRRPKLCYIFLNSIVDAATAQKLKATPPIAKNLSLLTSHLCFLVQ